MSRGVWASTTWVLFAIISKCSLVENLILHSSHLAGVIGRTRLTLHTDKVIRNLTSLSAILTVDTAHGIQKGHRHGLHPNGGVEHGKVILHIFH